MSAGVRKRLSCLFPGCLSAGMAATHPDWHLQCQARDFPEADQKTEGL